MWNFTVVAASIAAVLMAGRGERDRGNSLPQAESARVLALNALRELARGPVLEGDVLFHRVSSRAIPGLVYWWTFWMPPGTADMWYETVAGEVGTSSRRLESTDDWIVLARTAAWRPATGTDAIEGCAEAVQISSPERSQRFGTSLLRKGGTLREPEPRRDPLKPSQNFSWSAPAAKRVTKNLWEASFWMAEWGVYKYRCEISATTLKVVRVDRAPDWFMGSIRPGG